MLINIEITLKAMIPYKNHVIFSFNCQKNKAENVNEYECFQKGKMTSVHCSNKTEVRDEL